MTSDLRLGRKSGAILVITSKLSARLLWMQEADTRLGRMRELWRKKVGRKMQEVVIGLQPAGSSAGQQPPLHGHGIKPQSICQSLEIVFERESMKGYGLVLNYSKIPRANIICMQWD